jgi:hypothetical protein
MLTLRVLPLIGRLNGQLKVICQRYQLSKLTAISGKPLWIFEGGIGRLWSMPAEQIPKLYVQR